MNSLGAGADTDSDATLVAKCTSLLLADRHRQGGVLGVDDLLRISVRRGLRAQGALRVWAELTKSGVELAEAADPKDLTTQNQPVQKPRSARGDPIAELLRAAGTVRILVREEVATLIRRLRIAEDLRRDSPSSGLDDPRVGSLLRAGSRARDLLVNANLRLVLFVIDQFASSSPVEVQDLVQEGTIGLMRAIDRFDLSYGAEFSTYATWWIRQAVTRVAQARGRLVRLPVHRASAVASLYVKRGQLAAKLGRAPSVPELAVALSMPVDEVAFLLDSSRTVVSIDEPQEDDGGGGVRELADEEERDPAASLTSEELRVALASAIANLKPRERAVLTMRFGLDGSDPSTLEEVGEELEVTRERIRQIEKRALMRLAHPVRARILRDFL